MILGLDPGIETTWFWVIKKVWNSFDPLDFWVIKTSNRDDFWIRLVQIQEDINSLLKEFKPSLVWIEKLFFWTNIKTAISVAHARGVLISEVSKRWTDIYEFSPNEIKSMICWYWKAEKGQIQHMVAEHLWFDFKPKPDDAADALAVALCAGFSG